MPAHSPHRYLLFAEAYYSICDISILTVPSTSAPTQVRMDDLRTIKFVSI